MTRAVAMLLSLPALGSLGCANGGLTFEYRQPFSSTERAAIESVAARAVGDARQLLPALPPALRLTVQTGTKVIPETGETAETGLPGAVYWTVNPAHPGGVHGIVNAQLRATLFHELYHLVREARVPSTTIVDFAVGEGLATAFERDFGGGAPVPWGAYPPEVAQWTREFLTLPADAPRKDWMGRHPDGRRWVGYKVGTYLADLAARRSGRSLAELVTVPTAEILDLARRQP